MQSTSCEILGCMFHPPYLTSVQSTLSNMQGWVTHKVKSRLPGEIFTASDMQMIPLIWQKLKRNQRTSDEGERGESKSCLKTQHSKNEDHFRKGNPLTLLVGMQTSTATMENSVEIS